MGRNLVPATLGNIIGGVVFVGTAYALSFGSPGHAGEQGPCWPAAGRAALGCWESVTMRCFRAGGPPSRCPAAVAQLTPASWCCPPTSTAVFNAWDGALAAGGRCVGSRRRAADHAGDAGRHSLANGMGHHTGSRGTKLPAMPRVDENGGASMANGGTNGAAGV